MAESDSNPTPKHKVAEQSRFCLVFSWPRAIVVGFIAFFFLAGQPLIQLFHILFHGTSTSEVCSALRQIQAPIPNIIHQSWLTPDLPVNWQRKVDECKRMNPGYEHMLWTDDDLYQLLENDFPWFVPTYNQYAYNISRVDASRYFFLYKYGGVYLDIDTSCAVPFDDVIANLSGNSSVMLLATNPTGFSNSLMMTAKEHPFFRLLIDSLRGAQGWYMTPHWTIMKNAGPCFLHATFVRYPCQDDIAPIPVEVGAASFPHEQAASWHHWDGKLMKMIDRFHKVWVTIGVLFLVVVTLMLTFRLRAVLRTWLKTRKRVAAAMEEVSPLV